MEGDKIDVKILLFAQAADAVGSSELSLSIHASTVQEVLDAIPSLNKVQFQYAVALNERIVQSSEPIANGCTIAILPPVSGG